MKMRIILLVLLVHTNISFGSLPELLDNECILNDSYTNKELRKTIDELNQLLIKAAIHKDFESIKELYADDALLLAEFHPLLDGIDAIEHYYAEIFERHDVLTYTKETGEIIHLGNRILEIGSFKKTFKNLESQHGKYWNVWQPMVDGSLQLKSESFGYFHEIKDPLPWVVTELKDKTPGQEPRAGRKIPFELQAYDALGEEHVRERNVEKAVGTYTEDCKYFQFAKPAVEGKKALLDYYKGYYGHPVKIDSISIWTYDYVKVKDGFLKYSKFYVAWTVPNFSGVTEGTNTAYYRREKDGALKKHRLIGFHEFKD